eukprot:84877_1
MSGYNTVPITTDEYDKEENQEEHKEEIRKDKDGKCLQWIFEWLTSQTRLPSLILYAYLFWWMLIMFAFGIDNMTLDAWATACVLATFVFFALNAAAYHPPLMGQNGYLRHYFKIARFWLIPFCVSSISVACNASKG